MKICIHCGIEIPAGRLKALPDTRTCVNCSSINRVKGHPVITGKTAMTLQILPADQADALAKLQSRKGQGVSNGVKFHR